MVLPYINMNPPRVYTCSPSWTPLPPPSPYHPSGSSQCTSPKQPVSCIEPGLAIRFIYDIIHVSMPFSQIYFKYVLDPVSTLIFPWLSPFLCTVVLTAITCGSPSEGFLWLTRLVCRADRPLVLGSWCPSSSPYLRTDGNWRINTLASLSRGTLRSILPLSEILGGVESVSYKVIWSLIHPVLFPFFLVSLVILPSSPSGASWNHFPNKLCVFKYLS